MDVTIRKAGTCICGHGAVRVTHPALGPHPTWLHQTRPGSDHAVRLLDPGDRVTVRVNDMPRPAEFIGWDNDAVAIDRSKMLVVHVGYRGEAKIVHHSAVTRGA